MRNYSFDGEPYVVIERREGGVGAFVLGALVGVGVALLVAPRDGVATRAMLGNRARRMRDQVLDSVEELTETVEAHAEEARAGLQERVDGARGAVRRRTQQVADALDAGRAAALEARAELERRIAESKTARRERDVLAVDELAPDDV